MPEAVRTTTSHSGAAPAQPRQGAEAVEPGHGEVEQDQVRLEPAGGLDRFLAVGGLPDDVEAVLGQQPGQGRAGEGVVVYEKDSLSHQGFKAYRRPGFCRQE